MMGKARVKGRWQHHMRETLIILVLGGTNIMRIFTFLFVVFTLAGCGRGGGVEYLPQPGTPVAPVAGTATAEPEGGDLIVVPGPEGGLTIQGAIDRASHGDTVVVSAGWYSENVRLREGVDVLGTRGGHGGDAAIVYGTIWANNVEDVRVIGLDVRNRDVIVDVYNSKVRFDYCVFHAGTIRVDGVLSTTPEFTHCTFDGDNAVTSAILLIDGFAGVTRCTFERYDVALDTIRTDGPVGRVEKCVFDENGSNFTRRDLWLTEDVREGEGDLLHVNRGEEQYGLDVDSAAIFVESGYAGAFAPVAYRSRPVATVISTGRDFDPSEWTIRPLAIQLEVTGTAEIVVSAIRARFRTTAANYGGGGYYFGFRVSSAEATLRDGFVSVANGSEVVFFFNELIVRPGEARTILIEVDAWFLERAGDALELELEGVRWNESLKSSYYRGFLPDNFNGSGLGNPLPKSGGVYRLTADRPFGKG